MRRNTAVSVLSFAALAAVASVVAATDPAPPKAAVVPTPLGATASPAAALAKPANPPFVVPKPSGKMEVPAGQKRVQIEDKVSKLHPTSYSFTAPAGEMFWVGVSSPKGDVYLAAFEYKTKEPIGGTLPTDRASRVLLSFKDATELLFVAHTESDGTPFRFEVNLGGMNL